MDKHDRASSLDCRSVGLFLSLCHPCHHVTLRVFRCSFHRYSINPAAVLAFKKKRRRSTFYCGFKDTHFPLGPAFDRSFRCEAYYWRPLSTFSLIEAKVTAAVDLCASLHSSKRLVQFTRSNGGKTRPIDFFRRRNTRSRKKVVGNIFLPLKCHLFAFVCLVFQSRSNNNASAKNEGLQIKPLRGGKTYENSAISVPRRITRRRRRRTLL